MGEAGVADDWMARALEIVPLSVREYERSSARMRGLLDAFAMGMNAWLATRPHTAVRVLDRIEPWYPLALIRYKYYQNEFLGYAGLRQTWVERLLRDGWPTAGGGVTAARVSGDPVLAGPVRYHEAQFGPEGNRPHGSNQWAVAPTRTAEGRALLLINPHQRFVGVQRYAEIPLDSREGLRFSGLTVFGFLLPYMGHNGDLGWAYTDNYADHSDLYGEVFDDPADPMRYRYGDGYRSAETRTDSIRVLTDAGVEIRTFLFWKTHHGPIVGVSDDGRPLAVRLARMEEGEWFAQWDAMIRARSLDEWRAAVGMLRVAYMNIMYADRAGNIGYIYGSAVPRRNPGIDPSGILDGSDADTEWQGFHALEELPQVFNPPSGWLLNANSEPFTATRDLAFSRADFPPYMVGPETDNWRARSSRRARGHGRRDVRHVRCPGVGQPSQCCRLDSPAHRGGVAATSDECVGSDACAHGTHCRAAGRMGPRGADRVGRDVLVRAGHRAARAGECRGPALGMAMDGRARRVAAAARGRVGHDRSAVGVP